DFNNLMSGIVGLSEQLKETLTPDDPRRGDIDVILSAGHRAFSVTRQLLAFGRRQIAQPKVLNLNDVVRDVAVLLGRLIGEDIHLEMRLSATEPIKMDPGHLSQLLMNLAINSRDAMRKGGRLTVRSSDTKLEARPYVLLEIEDTGSGMDQETLSHIFEPFFTTKEKDQGTGLGLATVYGIVKQAGGDIH